MKRKRRHPDTADQQLTPDLRSPEEAKHLLCCTREMGVYASPSGGEFCPAISIDASHRPDVLDLERVLLTDDVDTIDIGHRFGHQVCRGGCHHYLTIEYEVRRPVTCNFMVEIPLNPPEFVSMAVSQGCLYVVPGWLPHELPERLLRLPVDYRGAARILMTLAVEAGGRRP